MRRCRGDSKLGDDETYTADDVVGWRFVRFEHKKLDGISKRERAEDEPSIVEFDVTEGESGSATDCKQGALVSSVRRERSVMTIQYNDGSCDEHGIHRGSLLCVCTDSEEALPVCVLQGRPGAIVLKPGCGDVNCLDDRLGPDLRFVHRCGGRDDRDCLDEISGRGRRCCADLKWQYLLDREVLRGKNSVKPIEGKGVLPVEEVGDVGLTEIRLPCQTGSG